VRPTASSRALPALTVRVVHAVCTALWVPNVLMGSGESFAELVGSPRCDRYFAVGDGAVLSYFAYFSLVSLLTRVSTPSS
jgi:hypothetical protein